MNAGVAPEYFGGGGYEAISLMEHSICVHEMAPIVQIYYIKGINFHAGGGKCIPPSRPRHPCRNGLVAENLLWYKRCHPHIVTLESTPICDLPLGSMPNLIHGYDFNSTVIAWIIDKTLVSWNQGSHPNIIARPMTYNWRIWNYTHIVKKFPLQDAWKVCGPNSDIMAKTYANFLDTVRYQLRPIWMSYTKYFWSWLLYKFASNQGWQSFFMSTVCRIESKSCKKVSTPQLYWNSTAQGFTYSWQDFLLSIITLMKILITSYHPTLRHKFPYVLPPWLLSIAVCKSYCRTHLQSWRHECFSDEQFGKSWAPNCLGIHRSQGLCGVPKKKDTIISWHMQEHV